VTTATLVPFGNHLFRVGIERACRHGQPR
jgi:hypothetical protein